ncbi:hypothetical protein [Spirillospora sp. NBC_01491]|uniref:hypothetical protein n=1 Tax=Spirillospora sp. NBC_01491 TaxID=2976007 RepID=UPI002E368F6C|nr:hypothetical protein [Spirillospora sp. NBC_01491]
MAGRDLATEQLDEDLLDVLPYTVRVREARRMLRLCAIAEAPWPSWEATAFLPYDEALPVLGAVARRPDATERATGYRLLIGCAGRSRDPEVLTRMLESLGRLRNDQDPVRVQAFRALAAVPESLLRPEHAAAVGQFADDALNARDCSYLTRHTLGRIAAMFCRQGAMRDDADLLVFALELYEKLVGHTGSAGLGDLGRTLRRGQEHRLVRALAPHLASGAARDDHRLVFTVVESLGRRRAARVPELQDALEAALDARDDGVLKRAIGLWLAPPGTRGERVARVVERDPSAVAVPAVFAAIARERTDLLHLVLSGRTPSGRFQRSDVTYVSIADPSWTLRWTGRQCAEYLALLDRLAGSTGAAQDQRGRAVRAVGTVPGAGGARLRPYLDSGDAYLRRVALTAMSWVASPQEVLPDLLAYASSDDAHVAVYAATRAARFVPPSALGAALAPLLTTGKITARKEALRMLVRHRVPGAMDLVAGAWDAAGQHPDVRAAIVSTMRDRLADPAAERILTEAADGPRDLARQVIGVPPLQVEERFRARYAALVLRVARSSDAEARAAALPVLPTWAPWAPEVPAVLAGVVTDLDSTPAWRSALGSLIYCVTAGDIGAAELRAAADSLSAAPAVPDAGAERDLPALQRLAALVGAVRAASSTGRDRAERAVRALDGHLPEPLAAELIAATLRWDAPDAARAVDALADRTTGVLAAQHVAAALAADPFGREGSTPEEILPHAVRLADRGDAAGGLFACALAERHGSRVGWPDGWRALLRALRAHECADVAFAARAVRTADE